MAATVPNASRDALERLQAASREYLAALSAYAATQDPSKPKPKVT